MRKNWIRKSKFLSGILLFMCSLSLSTVNAQIGIGTSLPKAKLHVYDGTFLSQTPQLPPEESPFYNPGDILDDSPVLRVFTWIHGKEAFRSIGAGINSWSFDFTKAGKFSFASGFDALAGGMASSAMGLRASTNYDVSFVCGKNVISSAMNSFVQGELSVGNGPHCVSFGTNLDNNSVVGSFLMGHSDFNFQSVTDHQIRMLFVGGYRFFTNANLTAGIHLGPNSSSWSVISDVRKKENFEPVDGRQFLQNMAKMPLTSWNYKGQDAAHMRHYGPMAQDFFKAFGKDSYGTIGADKTINQADLDGVTLIAIQALAKETDDLQRMNDELETELVKLRAKLLGRRDFRHPARRTLLARGKH